MVTRQANVKIKRLCLCPEILQWKHFPLLMTSTCVGMASGITLGVDVIPEVEFLRAFLVLSVPHLDR
jgi:hypothetical protein